jgi:hypothetical protein
MVRGQGSTRRANDASIRAVRSWFRTYSIIGPIVAWVLTEIGIDIACTMQNVNDVQMTAW